MSVLANKKDEFIRVLNNTDGKPFFTFEKIKSAAKEYNCIIVTDDSKTMSHDNYYEILAYYKNVKLIHPMFEKINYKDKDGVCNRPDNQEVVCFSMSGKGDFCEKSKNLLIIALRDKTESDCEI